MRCSDVQTAHTHSPGFFTSAFDSLLATNDLPSYSTRCSEVAAALNAVSDVVNTTAAELQALGEHDLFEAAATLQQHEKEHLRLEATLQVLRKEHAAGRWSWQLAAIAETADPASLRPPWAINRNCRVHEAGDTNAVASAGGCQCGAAEPTEEEYQAAVQECTQALQRVISGIHDACAELRHGLMGDE